MNEIKYSEFLEAIERNKKEVIPGNKVVLNQEQIEFLIISWQEYGNKAAAARAFKNEYPDVRIGLSTLRHKLFDQIPDQQKQEIIDKWKAFKDKNFKK